MRLSYRNGTPCYSFQNWPEVPFWEMRGERGDFMGQAYLPPLPHSNPEQINKELRETAICRHPTQERNVA